MELSGMNPFIRYSKIHTFHDSDGKDRFCYDCRLYYVKKGTGFFVVSGKKYELSDNTTIYLPFGTRYRFEFDTSDISIFVLNFDMCQDFSYEDMPMHTPYYENYDKQKIKEHILPEMFLEPIIKGNINILSEVGKICELFFSQSAYYRERSSALLKLCLIELIRHSDSSADTCLVNEVIHYIHGNYSDTSLTNTAIASVFGYHPYYLSSVVKKETGKTLHQHIIDHRISVAVNMLLSTDSDINTVSWKCGFESVSYFIKTFNGRMGTTPHKYRSQHMVF